MLVDLLVPVRPGNGGLRRKYCVESDGRWACEEQQCTAGLQAGRPRVVPTQQAAPAWNGARCSHCGGGDSVWSLWRGGHGQRARGQVQHAVRHPQRTLFTRYVLHWPATPPYCLSASRKARAEVSTLAHVADTRGGFCVCVGTVCAAQLCQPHSQPIPRVSRMQSCSEGSAALCRTGISRHRQGCSPPELRVEVPGGCCTCQPCNCSGGL